jgi:hypothetical protein
LIDGLDRPAGGGLGDADPRDNPLEGVVQVCLRRRVVYERQRFLTPDFGLGYEEDSSGPTTAFGKIRVADTIEEQILREEVGDRPGLSGALKLDPEIL